MFEMQSVRKYHNRPERPQAMVKAASPVQCRAFLFARCLNRARSANLIIRGGQEPRVVFSRDVARESPKIAGFDDTFWIAVDDGPFGREDRTEQVRGEMDADFDIASIPADAVNGNGLVADEHQMELFGAANPFGYGGLEDVKDFLRQQPPERVQIEDRVCLQDCLVSPGRAAQKFPFIEPGVDLASRTLAGRIGVLVGSHGSR